MAGGARPSGTSAFAFVAITTRACGLRLPFDLRRHRWLSRRLDSLDGARSHAELAGDLQDAPIPPRQRLPDSCLGAGGDLGATEGLAIGAGALETGIDAADDH